MPVGSGSTGGSGCCNTGGSRGAKGAKKRVVKKPIRKYNSKKGGASDDVDDSDAKSDTVQQDIEDLYSADEQDKQLTGGARKKKGSKVAVKRALSPYNKFVKEQFAILKKKFPDDKAPQIMQKVAIEWNKTKK
jgi:hypothetical protein